MNQSLYVKFKKCSVFFAQWKELRRLIINNSTNDYVRIKEQLFWYGIPLKKLIGFRALAKVLMFNLTGSHWRP